MAEEQFLHGAQVVEVSNGTRPIQTVASAVIGIVGTAPDSAAAVAATTTLGAGTSSLTITADAAGIEGNEISIRLRNPGAVSQALSVSLSGKAITVNLATDNAGVITSTPALIKTALDANAPIAALVTVTSGGSGVIRPTAVIRLSGGLNEAFPLNTPTLVANNKTLAARLGANGSLPGAIEDILRQAGAVIVVVRVAVDEDPLDMTNNVLAGVDKLLEAESALGVVPRLLIAPEFSAQKVIADQLVSVGGKLRAYVFADGPNSTDAEAVNYMTSFGSDRITVIDPWLVRLGANRSPSAAWAGATAKSDNERGFWWSPSNVELLGFEETSRAVPFRLSDPTCEANILNEAGVTTIVRQNGIRLWGNHSASVDPAFTFIAVRRTADLIQDSILRAHLWAIDRPMTRVYFESVVESVNAYLKRLKALGAIAGGECWADPDLNTPESIAAGKAIFDFKFSPSYPAEQITFRSQIVNDYLIELVA